MRRGIELEKNRNKMIRIRKEMDKIRKLKKEGAKRLQTFFNPPFLFTHLLSGSVPKFSIFS
jgi:hypothetical protein